MEKRHVKTRWFLYGILGTAEGQHQVVLFPFAKWNSLFYPDLRNMTYILKD